MVIKVKTVNIVFSSKFCEDSQIQHEDLFEGDQMAQQLKCVYNNKDEDNIWII